MSRFLTDAEWNDVHTLLAGADAEAARAAAAEITDEHPNGQLAAYGLPERRTNSIVMGSWNIPDFGGLKASDGPSQDFYATFAARCDLIAIQEITTKIEQLLDLRDRMAALNPSADYRILCSDVSGAPAAGGTGAERLAFIFDEKRIQHTHIASDISFDRTEVFKKVNASLEELRDAAVAQAVEMPEAERHESFFKQITGWNFFDRDKSSAFFDFARSPHFATFKVLGEGDASYEVAIANAHLHYGKDGGMQREKEFLALLEWIYERTRKKHDAPMTMIIGDLNLDMRGSNAERRKVIRSYIDGLNTSSRMPIHMNFPFLYEHPIQGEIATNSREDETFDHIAYFHNDPRIPKAEHNLLPRSEDRDFFDYGMFDFMKLFRDAGVINATPNSTDRRVVKKNASDHMPIWARIPVPVPNQWTFDQL